eukprot:3822923-Pleurochrysis_carterae.AAC.1
MARLGKWLRRASCWACVQPQLERTVSTTKESRRRGSLMRGEVRPGWVVGCNEASCAALRQRTRQFRAEERRRVGRLGWVVGCIVGRQKRRRFAGCACELAVLRRRRASWRAAPCLVACGGREGVFGRAPPRVGARGGAEGRGEAHAWVKVEKLRAAQGVRDWFLFSAWHVVEGEERASSCRDLTTSASVPLVAADGAAASAGQHQGVDADWRQAGDRDERGARVGAARRQDAPDESVRLTQAAEDAEAARGAVRGGAHVEAARAEAKVRRDVCRTDPSPPIGPHASTQALCLCLRTQRRPSTHRQVPKRASTRKIDVSPPC